MIHPTLKNILLLIGLALVEGLAKILRRTIYGGTRSYATPVY